jgi:hypothetical protein
MCSRAIGSLTSRFCIIACARLCANYLKNLKIKIGRSVVLLDDFVGAALEPEWGQLIGGAVSVPKESMVEELPGIIVEQWLLLR